jgi:serine/threonine-protein kinase
LADDGSDLTQPPVIAQAQSQSQVPGPGATFGPYSLVRKMGQGGMAEVLLAEKRGDDGEVSRCVIKRVSSVLRSDRDFREMFIEESRIARMIHHPNIVECFDAGTIDGISYMALELVEGLDLGALVGRLAPEPLAVGAALDIGIAVAGALDHAHHLADQAGRPLDLVHRDVSPENILISWSGEVKLLDFGISRFKDRNYATQIGVRKGKAGYMAPEYVQGAPLDARADIFQLGVTMVEILSGKRLFEADELRPRDFAGMQAVLEEHLGRAGIPPELLGLLARMCAPDPKDRPAEAREVARELERIAAELTSSYRLSEIVSLLAPTSQTKKLPRSTDLLPPPRRRSSPTLLALALLGLVLIAAALAYLIDRSL